MEIVFGPGSGVGSSSSVNVHDESMVGSVYSNSKKRFFLMKFFYKVIDIYIPVSIKKLFHGRTFDKNHMIM